MVSVFGNLPVSVPKKEMPKMPKKEREKQAAKKKKKKNQNFNTRSLKKGKKENGDLGISK